MPSIEKEKTNEAQAVISFRKELLEGNEDLAREIERTQSIPVQAIASIVNSVYETFVSEEKYLEARDLAKSYNLPDEKVSDAIYLFFRGEINKGNIEDAISFAITNNLPDYEISRAAIRGIESAINGQRVEQAIEIKQKYNITSEQIGSSWQAGFDTAFQSKKFFEAALLSREFGMSERKTVLTAVKAFRQGMKQNNFEKLIEIDNKFRFFNDNGFSFIGEEEARNLILTTEDFFREKLKSEKHFKDSVNLIISIGIIFQKVGNHTLRDLVHFIYKQAIEIHQLKLDQDKYDEALWFKGELNLSEENTPKQTLNAIYDQAVKYHNKLLKKKNISQAFAVKDDYELLGGHSDSDHIDLIQNTILEVIAEMISDGKANSAEQLVKEYNIPQKELADVGKAVVIKAISEGEYDNALQIITKFKIDASDYELKSAAIAGLERCYADGYYETTANLGYVFEISTPEVRKAALKVWEDFMSRGEYKKSKLTKKKHRLTKKSTEKIATSEYNKLLDANKTDLAQKIREEYKISISFISIILEIIKKIIALLFGGEPKAAEEATVTSENGTPEESANPLEEEPIPQEQVTQ